ncbi:hypothetical protein Ddye_003828 [Dipteronia dyeriana]|uniref:Uncharacterized protein n=1 Tax=Dipteronia dyeriana TaxID=168575 RepID=A0AAD9XSZ8_9ROSI|nr:hypothetical protein Ddye_003828 [Dipteronia dyeriana]
MGGLGIKNMKFMNQTVLAKAGWRLLSDNKGLWANLLLSKYYNNGNFDALNNRNARNAYSTWKCLIHGAKLLWRGMKWRMGDGESIGDW